tara:strand:- start:128 stop:346 length:219 start_codon:yes stop_codon:yes gene_type:complete
MLTFLLPLASKIISDAVAKIPENEELGEKLVEICLVILKKAVKLTKTDMDDQLLAVVEKAILARVEEPSSEE